VFRYLRASGITTNEELAASKFEGAKKVVEKLRAVDFTYPSYRKRYEKAFVGLNTQEIIRKSSSPSEAIIMVGFQPDAAVDIQVLKEFLRANTGKIETEPYLSQYRKLVCRFDRLVYGF
jgi:hypothetical protein